MPPSDPASDPSWPSDLSACFDVLPAASHWLVALSGGLDSLFLLHCLAQRAGPGAPRLTAIHINHGLQPEADAWARWCQQRCRELGVPLISETLALDGKAPDLEARARKARYQVFEQHLREDGLLLMAHHGDDQAETVLLRLMRGSGVRGLSGMPATRSLGAGKLHRPLLPLRRERIESLARGWGLSWCEDHSNRDTRFDRNYLRHEVLPLLRARWPAAVERINRSAEHAASADRLLGELVEQDDRSCSREGGLSLAELGALPRARQEALIRQRVRHHGLQPPGERKLASGLDALLHAPEDRQPELRWQSEGQTLTLRRYQDRLWLVPEVQQAPEASVHWTPGEPLPWRDGVLETEPVDGEGLKASDHGHFRVSGRQGGERFRPEPGRHTQSLKKWLQQQQVPPWERDRLPLIYLGDELIAIASLWITPHWRAAPGESGYRLCWHAASRSL